MIDIVIQGVPKLWLNNVIAFKRYENHLASTSYKQFSDLAYLQNSGLQVEKLNVFLIISLFTDRIFLLQRQLIDTRLFKLQMYPISCCYGAGKIESYFNL